MRWLYHLRIRDTNPSWPYAPTSLASEGFIHASYRDSVRESATLYFSSDADLEVLRIDPRKLAARIDRATTPRGEMPHICGEIEEAAVVQVIPLETFSADQLPDLLTADDGGS